MAMIEALVEHDLRKERWNLTLLNNESEYLLLSSVFRAIHAKLHCILDNWKECILWIVSEPAEIKCKEHIISITSPFSRKVDLQLLV